MRRTDRLKAGLTLWASLAGAHSFAQTPPDAGSLLRQQEQLEQKRPGQIPPRQARQAPLELQDGGGQKIRLKRVQFSGATPLASEAQLQALVADAIGKELDFLGLQSLAERVTNHLKSKGWFLARAYLPRQDITDGSLEIALIAGRLSQKQPVTVSPVGKTALRVDPARLQAIADQTLPAGAPAQEDDVNRAVLLINDLPGLTARSRLEPGEQDGETRITIAVEESPPLSTSLNLTNQGSRDTGTAQLTGNFALNNPLGIGDQISLAATASEGNALARLGYSLPMWGAMGADGWRLNFGYTDLSYRVLSASGRSNGLEGASQSTSVGLLYPWLRSRTANVYFNLSHARRELVDRSRAGTLRDKTVAVSAVGFNGDPHGTRLRCTDPRRRQQQRRHRGQGHDGARRAHRPRWRGPQRRDPQRDARRIQSKPRRRTHRNDWQRNNHGRYGEGQRQERGRDGRPCGQR